MLSKARNQRAVITEMLREQALLLGGIVAVYPVEDEVVDRLVGGLERLRERYLPVREEAEELAAGRGYRKGRFHPHPAIERFLRVLRDSEGSG